ARADVHSRVRARNRLAASGTRAGGGELTMVFEICGALLVLAGAITMYRVLAGPGTLDRLVGVDSLVAMAMAGLAVWACAGDDPSVIPAIVALSLVGFLGSACVARFRIPDDHSGDRL